MRRMRTTGKRQWMQRMGEEVRCQSKSSQECGENCSSERLALSITVFCWLSPDQSYVREPNQRTVFIPRYIPAGRHHPSTAAQSAILICISHRAATGQRPKNSCAGS